MPEQQFVFNDKDLLFMRELEHKLLDQKYKIAEQVKEETIDSLYKQATIKTDSGISSRYAILHEDGLPSAAKNAQKAVIDAAIKRRTANAFEEYKTRIDRVVFNLSTGDGLKKDALNDIWNKLLQAYDLTGAPPASHHIDFIKALQDAFSNKLDSTKQLADETNSAYKSRVERRKKENETEYYEARLRYYQWVKGVQPVKWTEPSDNELYYRLGKERKLLENEIANKKEDQALRNKGLRMAKLYALAQGFFIAGGMFARMLAWGLSGPLLFVNIIVSVVLFSMTTRSNWITINEEMGPLLKKLFFDPNLAHLSYPKRLWQIVRRVNIFDGWNTFKGFTNLIAGALIGVLTFAGTLLLLAFMPAIPAIGTLSLGVFGSGSILVIALGAVLAAVTTLVYFVISNLYQLKMNADPNWQEPDLERLKKLRTITHTSELNPIKRYGMNIVIGMMGVGAVLMAAGMDLAPIIGALIPASIPFATPLVVMITGLLVALAIYGISPFYKARTMNSTKRLIAGDTGLDFHNLDGSELDNLDLTGRNPPDFFEHKAPVFPENPGGWFAKKLYQGATFFFNMDRDDSRYVRVGNAIGQGTPAFAGASAFASLVLLFGYGLAGIGATAVAHIVLPVSLTIGAVVGVFAAWGSYSANSTRLRRVHEHITEVGVLEKDRGLIKTQGLDENQTRLLSLGEEHTNTKLYKQSRAIHCYPQDQTNHFWLPLFGYNGIDKIKSAENMMAQSDEIVASWNSRPPEGGYDLNDLNKEARHDKSNPLEQGELGGIAHQVLDLANNRRVRLS